MKEAYKSEGLETALERMGVKKGYVRLQCFVFKLYLFLYFCVLIVKNRFEARLPLIRNEIDLLVLICCPNPCP